MMDMLHIKKLRAEYSVFICRLVSHTGKKKKKDSANQYSCYLKADVWPTGDYIKSFTPFTFKESKIYSQFKNTVQSQLM